MVDRIAWSGDERRIDCDALAQDIARSPQIYPAGASANITWLAAEFSAVIPSAQVAEHVSMWISRTRKRSFSELATTRKS